MDCLPIPRTAAPNDGLPNAYGSALPF